MRSWSLSAGVPVPVSRPGWRCSRVVRVQSPWRAFALGLWGVMTVHTLALAVLPTSQEVPVRQNGGPPRRRGSCLRAAGTQRNARERCSDDDVSHSLWSGSRYGWLATGQELQPGGCSPSRDLGSPTQRRRSGRARGRWQGSPTGRLAAGFMGSSNMAGAEARSSSTPASGHCHSVPGTRLRQLGQLRVHQ